MLGPGNTLAHITQSGWCGLDAALECVVIGLGCTKTFENEGLRMVTRGMQELIAQRNRKKYENLQLCIKGCVSATKTSITRTQLKRHDANPKTHLRTCCIIHSATVSPPIALCMSLMVESSPLPLGLVPGLAPPVT